RDQRGTRALPESRGSRRSGTGSRRRACRQPLDVRPRVPGVAANGAREAAATTGRERRVVEVRPCGWSVVLRTLRLDASGSAIAAQDGGALEAPAFYAAPHGAAARVEAATRISTLVRHLPHEKDVGTGRVGSIAVGRWEETCPHPSSITGGPTSSRKR